jgi:hypothetical protein
MYLIAAMNSVTEVGWTSVLMLDAVLTQHSMLCTSVHHCSFCMFPTT